MILFSSRPIEPISLRIGLGGWVRMQVLRPDRTVRHDTGWFPNLITNGGLDRVGQGECANFCSVGTSTTAPSNTDSALFGYVAGATVGQKSGTLTTGAAAGSPYYGYARVQFEFAVGQAAGNLNEVGFGWTNGNSNLFSRALISPTATVLSDEILVVTYELRRYAPVSDVTGTVLIAGVNRDFVMRAASVTSGGVFNWGSFSFGVVGGAQLMVSSNIQLVFPSTSTLGAVTGIPSGTQVDTQTVTNAAYTPSNYYRDGTVIAGLSQGNASGGIACATVVNYLGKWQISFSPVLEKDNTKTLSLTYRFSWTRH